MAIILLQKRLEEIIKTSRLSATDDNVVHNKFDYFYYYESKVRYKNKTFSLFLNIGRAKNDGVYHMYDITDRSKKRDTAGHNNGLVRPEGNALTNGISNNILPDYKGNVKRTLEERVTGDEYENALDTLELVEDVNGTVDEYGYVRVYHRTNLENANKIKNTGKMFAKEDGLFFSTKEKSEYNKGYGDSVVAFDIPVEKLVLDDMFYNELHFRLPLGYKRQLDVGDYIVNEYDEAGSIGSAFSNGEKYSSIFRWKARYMILFRPVKSRQELSEF